MTHFSIPNSVALVTGASKKNGIGQAIVHALLANGASKVYATARDKSQLDDLVDQYDGKVVAVTLDVTDLKSIEILPEKCPDVNLVVNNAGVVNFVPSGFDISAAETEMKVNYFGPMAIVKSFIPVFEKLNTPPIDGTTTSNPTAVVNINSTASLLSFPMVSTYCASKAAAHSLTQAQRRELSAFNTLVIGVYPGAIDTAMIESFPMQKAPPSMVADEVVKALKEGREDIFPEPMSIQIYEDWKADAKAAEKKYAAFAP